MPEFKFNLFLLGCLGGLLPDVLRILKNKGSVQSLQCFKHLGYWVSLVLQVALGGLAVYLLNTADRKEAVAVGFAAPEIISKLLSAPPKLSKPAPAPETRQDTKRQPQSPLAPESFTIRTWWAR